MLIQVFSRSCSVTVSSSTIRPAALGLDAAQLAVLVETLAVVRARLADDGDR